MENEIRKTKEESIGKFVADHLSNINPSLAEKGIVLTILEGTAKEELPLIVPNKVHLNGTIEAPYEFYSKRKDLHDKNKCHVVYDVLNGKLELVVDENFQNDNYKISGKIEKNSELTAFFINTGKTFDPKELLQLLKFNRIYFSDITENAKICLALSTFKAKVSQAFEQIDNQRTEAKQSLESKIEHDLQESFMLKIALFKGQPQQTFKVNVCLQVRGGGVVVYLESVELKEMEMKQGGDIMAAQVSKFSDIVCIEQ